MQTLFFFVIINEMSKITFQQKSKDMQKIRAILYYDKFQAI